LKEYLEYMLVLQFTAYTVCGDFSEDGGELIEISDKKRG